MRLDRDYLVQDRTPRPTGEDGSHLRLTEDELGELMKEAIARHGKAERTRDQHAPLASLEDALQIARQLDIPEEHVLAAARAMDRKRTLPERRQRVRNARRSVFLMWLGFAVVGLLAASWFNAVALLAVVLLLAGAGMLYFGWRWLFAPVSDAEADRVELPPVEGTCRVCGRTAQNPRSTFCEEHRYQGPGYSGQA